MGKKRVVKKTEEELLAEREEREKTIKAKEKKAIKKSRVKSGRIYINATYNNTVITLTDSKGDTLAWVTAGSLGFKGTKKATPYAASRVATVIGNKAEKIGVQEIDIYIKGVGSGRNSALKSLSNRTIKIKSINDVTPIPHNGCRPPKTRRV
jgi:small subunit ribosomal protein S11